MGPLCCDALPPALCCEALPPAAFSWVAWRPSVRLLMLLVALPMMKPWGRSFEMPTEGAGEMMGMAWPPPEPGLPLALVACCCSNCCFSRPMLCALLCLLLLLRVPGCCSLATAGRASGAWALSSSFGSSSP
eukprot:1159080-Pelagomonas_calceolata.AAC.16